MNLNLRYGTNPKTYLRVSFAVAMAAGALVTSASLAGCHSAFIETTLVNRTDQQLRLVEVDYPSASFGTQSLAPGASFHYRFKVIGEGPVKLSWTDAVQKEHNAEGPALHEGQQGSLTVTIIPGQTAWQTTFTN